MFMKMINLKKLRLKKKPSKMIIDNESNFLRAKKYFSENVVAIRTEEGWKNIEF